MILTIKNANFSTAGIGTLSTYIIRKSIGSGVTHSIPNYIEKGLNATWVLTLVSGYTFGEYSIMMGNTPITPEVTETTMTITIPAVTANVTISVPTINESTGEEDGGGDIPVMPPVTPDEPEGPTVYTLTSDDVEIGGWGTYEKMDANNRIRTKELINLSAGSIITIDKPDNLEICVSVLQPDETTTVENKNWVVRELWSQNKTISVPSNGLLHLVWKRSDDKTMSLSDWSGTYTYTK